jgi:hypothetical protein
MLITDTAINNYQKAMSENEPLLCRGGLARECHRLQSADSRAFPKGTRARSCIRLNSECPEFMGRDLSR